jgi:hypothetical protein
MNIKIEVEARTVYGNTLIYPVNDAAHALAKIAGTKTLSPNVILLAKEIGCQVVEIHTPKVVQ